MPVLAMLTDDPRVTVRRAGSPDPQGRCVVYWMQRAQRGRDNPALDVAVAAANELGKPVVVFFAPVPFYPHANLRHYRFLAEGIPDIAESLRKRNVGFVLRRFPESSLLRFCEEVNPGLVVCDENPMREPEAWRRKAAKKLRVPLWTVDADVIVPLEAFRESPVCLTHHPPRLQAQLARFLVAPKNPAPHIFSGKSREGYSVLILTSTSLTAGSWIVPSLRSRSGAGEARKHCGCSAILSSISCAATLPGVTIRSSSTPAGCLRICISDISARSR
jgi:deoxyribodipyrimidine photo-lyase